MALTWKDVSSYSRGEAHVPKTWKAQAGKLSLVVTRHIHYEPDDWLIECSGVIQPQLAGKDLEDAKTLVVGLVRIELEKALRAVSDLRPGGVRASLGNYILGSSRT